jgi:hypothetical protein
VGNADDIRDEAVKPFCMPLYVDAAEREEGRAEEAEVEYSILGAAGSEAGAGGGEGGKVFLICVTMSMHRVLSPIKGPSRMGSVWAQPSYIRRNTWGKWGE